MNELVARCHLLRIQGRQAREIDEGQGSAFAHGGNLRYSWVHETGRFFAFGQRDVHLFGVGWEFQRVPSHSNCEGKDDSGSDTVDVGNA